jgi:hypothetical protein
MHIVSIGVYGHNGERREVNFEPGSLNILTGKSKTGKSALLDIAEFCLGRDMVTIPTGVISDKASWYFTLVQFEQARVLICRPNPESASTNRAMVTIGDLDLQAPGSGGVLEVNADTDVVKDVLSERLKIERFTVEPDSGSLRNPFEVSSKQALFFCFQNQNEIANRAILFHRQNESDVRPTIRGVLPYFLGVSTPEQSALQRQLLQARRNLQRLQIEIRSAEADLGEQNDRNFTLLRSAVTLGILSESDQLVDAAASQDLLKQILSFKVDVTEDPSSSAVGARQGELLEEGRVLRIRLQELDDQLALVSRLDAEQSDVNEELSIQRDRLSAVGSLLPRGQASDFTTDTCPLCDQELETADQTVADLRDLLNDLNARLQASRGSMARRRALVDELRESRERLLAALRENVADLDALAAQSRDIASGREQREQVAFLQGRVSQELGRGVEIVGGVGGLRAAERRARGQVARLEDLLEADDPTDALRRAMDSLSELMTDYARELVLEGSDYFVRLDPNELTVTYQRPGGRVALSRMGSAENWVGYHLVAHLALHHWFVTHDRPVPRFLMLDQPTQAFFPEEVVDAAEDEDADWSAVRRQFELMRDVVASLDGALQVIVCDHANLADEWFQASVVDNWRNGVALIPDDWPLKVPTVAKPS